jgi:hypothetical protein
LRFGRPPMRSVTKPANGEGTGDKPAPKRTGVGGLRLDTRYQSHVVPVGGGRCP